MKKLHITFIILSFLCGNLVAQENLKDGYIITKTNDTIYGKIDLRTSSINQTRCLFISEDTGKQTFYPGDIKGYRYISPSKYYISKEITIGENKSTRFIEYLVEGGLNLYYIKENNQIYFLFEEEGKDPFYITQDLLKEVDSKIYEDNRYIGLLTYYFQESSPSLLKLIKEARFKQKSMISIAKQYNDENCTTPGQESCTIFENQSPDKDYVKIEISAYTGIQNTSYIRMQDTNYPSRDQSVQKVFPMIGAHIFIYNPLWTKNLGVIGDISFSKMKEESPIFDIVHNYQRQYKYDFYTLALKAGIKYRYSKFKFRPSFSAGFTYTNIIKNNGEIISTNSEPKELDIRKSHPGFFLTAGMEYNIKNTQSIFMQFSHDFYTKTDLAQKRSEDYIKIWQVKVGYTF